MGRSPCCSKVGLHRGPWSQREDTLLVSYIEAHGEGQWRSLPKKAGLLRCGKSCRLRWMNYLRPGIKRGNITPDEEDLIMRLHLLLGNRWSLIAGRLPGRTDNEIKNYWNTHLIKRVKNKGGADEINTKRKNSKRVHYATKKKKKRESGIVESERIKVHLPKAIKVTRLSLPRINSFESNITNSASIGSTVDGQPEGCGLLIDDDHDQGGGLMIDGNDNVSPSMSQQSAILEEMYEEYLQLIQDDAMSHSNKNNNDKCLDDMVQEVEAELDVLVESLLV
ncbi:hypothetical protein Droror1_Dr00027480 [Drosera rotundifolia]